MWQLYMVLALSNGRLWLHGGPMIIDGFKTESACIAHMKKIEDATPKDRPFLGGKYEFSIKTCMKVEK